MGNNTNHYFGAYLVVHTNETERTYSRRECDKGHRSPSGSFCSKCGGQLKNKEYREKFHPRYLVDWVIDDKWEDELAVITPPSLENKGVIIAISNSGYGDWLRIFGREWTREEDQVKEFPGVSRVQETKAEFSDRHKDIIEAIGSSHAVKFIEIKAGYVLDAEY